MKITWRVPECDEWRAIVVSCRGKLLFAISVSFECWQAEKSNDPCAHRLFYFGRSPRGNMGLILPYILFLFPR